MKLILILFAVSTAMWAGDAAEDVKKTDRQWADATLHRDTAVLNRILADDLKYVHGNASVQNKKEFIDSLLNGNLTYHTIDFQEMDVRVLGDSALVMSKAHLFITMGGQDQRFDVRFLRVYVKRKGNWQLLAHQATRLN